MKLAYAIFVVATMLGAVALWASDMTNDWVFTGALVGAGLTLIAVFWTIGTLLRNRRHRRLMEMRDSALW